ncbi:hypothetical protein GCM10022200_13980 [Microbacterium awajiense]|uniref:Uncharacterized protein n=1 Tax=Microbacterium awajiense TaxID=415214 RepID=A0ABP7AHL2_9MICO
MIDSISRLLERILEHDDPVVRNRLITQCYRDLAEQMATVLGRRDLSWFVFGAWASGTAGAAIRGEGLPLDFGTSRNVAAGNLAIIRDVAPPFIRWLREVELDGGPTDAALERTLADPRLTGAPRLAAAIRAYHAATLLAAAGADDLDEDADKQVAELMLLGNLLLGAHEQEVVDDFIDAAMPLGGIFGLVTTRFVRIETPDGPVDVCRDVLAPFPPVLTELTNADLCAECARFGQSTGLDVAASNALVWEDYDDRMGFILTFFRAYQRDERFFDVPPHFLPEPTDGGRDVAVAP